MSLVKVLLASLACVSLLTACAKEDKNDDSNSPDVTEKTKQAERTMGIWRVEDKKYAQSSDLPSVMAIEIDGDLNFYIHQFNHSTQQAERFGLGQVILVGEGHGELSLNADSYLQWLKPWLKSTCGASSECIATKDMMIRTNLNAENPTWQIVSVEPKAEQGNPTPRATSGIYNRLSVSIHPEVLYMQISGQNLQKSTLGYKDRSTTFLGQARRRIETAPQGMLKLIGITLIANGKTEELPADTTLAVTCNNINVPIPRDIKGLVLNTDLTISLSEDVRTPTHTETLIYSTASIVTAGSFHFWNLYRCSAVDCSKVQIEIADREVNLRERIENCFDVTYHYTPATR